MSNPEIKPMLDRIGFKADASAPAKPPSPDSCASIYVNQKLFLLCGNKQNSQIVFRVVLRVFCGDPSFVMTEASTRLHYRRIRRLDVVPSRTLLSLRTAVVPRTTN